MAFRFNCLKPLYLNQRYIEENAQLMVKCGDGHIVRLNHLFLISWSKQFLNILQNSNCPLKEIVVLCNYSRSQLLMLNDFISKGTLPCSENDILNGTIKSDMNEMFLNFGIDLKKVLEMSSIKREMRQDITLNDQNDIDENNLEQNDLVQNDLIESIDEENDDSDDENDLNLEEMIILNQILGNVDVQMKVPEMGEITFKCDLCHKRFSTIEDQEYHLIDTHGLKKIEGKKKDYTTTKILSIENDENDLAQNDPMEENEDENKENKSNVEVSKESTKRIDKLDIHTGYQI